HLYVSDELCPEFPGWNYSITDVIPFNKSGIKSVREKYPKINVATRNFPLTAPELVKKLKVIEGGDHMLFGAILNDGSKAMIITGREIRQ
ncbi:MAG: SAM-dependent methyltransferase, partial [Duncaniella sp.]|nr:SAM-dependent methyltransferase [Duncaniella sp.]